MIAPQPTPSGDALPREIPGTLFSQEWWGTIARELRLSHREHQIVQCIFEGRKEAAIALDLGISAHTVHSHIGRLHRKLGVRDRCELLLRVFETYLSLESGAPAPDPGAAAS